MTALTRWDPFRDLVNLQRDLGRIVGDLGVVAPRRWEFGPIALGMSVDIIQKGEDVVIRAEMPGVKPEDIDISVAEGMLTLKGERREEGEVKEEDYLIRETSFGSFERTMRLPEGVKPDSIHAEYRDGILEVTLPHARELAEPTAVHIPVETQEAKQIPAEAHH